MTGSLARLKHALTPAEIARLGSFVKGIRTWQRRVGDPTGRRMNYGVELKGPNYKVVGRKWDPLDAQMRQALEDVIAGKSGLLEEISRLAMAERVNARMLLSGSFMYHRCLRWYQSDPHLGQVVDVHDMLRIQWPGDANAENFLNEWIKKLASLRDPSHFPDGL